VLDSAALAARGGQLSETGAARHRTIVDARGKVADTFRERPNRSRYHHAMATRSRMLGSRAASRRVGCSLTGTDLPPSFRCDAAALGGLITPHSPVFDRTVQVYGGDWWSGSAIAPTKSTIRSSHVEQLR